MNFYIRVIRKYYYVILFIWLALVCLVLPFLPEASQSFKIGAATDPKAESSVAEATILKNLPYGGSRIVVLYSSPKLKAYDPTFKSEVELSLNGLKQIPLKYSVISPYENQQQISSDQHTAYAWITLKEKADEAANQMALFRAKLAKPKSLHMIIGGEPAYIADIKEISRKDLFRAESIAIPIAIFILILVMGTFVAGLLPMVSGLLSIMILVGMLYWLGHFIELSIFVLNIATLLGLGLSLDYTLLIVNRFCEELKNGLSKHDAIIKTLATAGKSVFFSGITVFISLGALLLFPVNILFSLGIGGLCVVIVTMFVALLFLPALLVLLGNNVNRGMFRRRSNKGEGKSIWFKLAMSIMRHPIFFVITTMIFLLLLGLPFIHVKINQSNPQALPKWAESRQIFDKFQDYFNTNELSPIIIVAESKDNSIFHADSISTLYHFVHHFEQDKRVNNIRSIVSFDPNLTLKQYQQLYQIPINNQVPKLASFVKRTTKGRYTLITVISKYPFNDPNTYTLIKDIRTFPIGKQMNLKVGGISAVTLDTIQIVYSRFFYLIAAIGIITYCVLLILLRSIFLPLKAVVMNFFSLMVSYGMLVFIFQEGHFASLLNFTAQGFVDLNLPILLFFGIFGISMDYEVFLLTRIKEFYDRTKDNNLSVALGLEKSARVISSAALVIIIVCAAFATSNVLFVKAFGLGLALAVAMDATIIRMLLVPATMRLMGKWNWYLPRWLDKILPTIRFN